jgi:hypothetical protein
MVCLLRNFNSNSNYRILTFVQISTLATKQPGIINILTSLAWRGSPQLAPWPHTGPGRLSSYFRLVMPTYTTVTCKSMPQVFDFSKVFFFFFFFFFDKVFDFSKHFDHVKCSPRPPLHNWHDFWFFMRYRYSILPHTILYSFSRIFTSVALAEFLSYVINF